jgi:tRNA-specific 2-thiouridylase
MNAVKRILVAVSGGMDSAVAAALLKTQGYDVLGLHMQLGEIRAGNQVLRGAGNCCSVVDPNAAKEICARLEIPLHVVDVHEEFQYEIIDYVVHDFLQARVPNPCVVCNSGLKFRILMKMADQLKCDTIATGHYAKSIRNPGGTETNLYKAADHKQDQSYLLFGLKQDQLARVMMPLGELLRSNVRKMADTFHVPHNDTDVHPTCFVEDGKFIPLLQSHSSERMRGPGVIVNQEGTTVGRHNGLVHYLLGQGNISGIEKQEYLSSTVVGYDLKLNALIVGEKKDLLRTGLVATRCNWIGLIDFSKGVKAKAKIGPHRPEVECTVTLLADNSVWVDFSEPQQMIIPGQALVFYQDDLVLGGGWIAALTDPITTKLRHRLNK